MNNRISANVFNIQHFSLQDGAGIRTVVFFKGCPLSCTWCHNPESNTYKPELAFYEKKCVKCKKCEMICPNGVHRFINNEHLVDRNLCANCGLCVNACDYAALEMIGKNMSIDEIMEEIEKDDIFFGENGGVTVSGGEPFMQTEALTELAVRCKDKGYSIFVETSGYTDKKNIEKAIPYIDCFLYDCKETDEAKHIEYTGKSNKIIIENLSVLEKHNCNVILRCPIIPNVNDRKEHYTKIAEIANTYHCIKSIEIMKYHPLGIEKCKNIGREPAFRNNDFLDNDIANLCVSTISELTGKKVSVSE